MKRIASFEKVSFDRFKNDLVTAFPDTNTDIEKIYNDLPLPRRATAGSAGYDFFLPVSISLPVNEEITIPTGIRVKINEGWVLKLYPRSSLGFKFRLQLNNTVGVIDSDYYFSDNEGHIFIRMTNRSNAGKSLELQQFSAFAQGVFVEFGITFDDDAQALRNGGFGSTN